MAPKWMRTDRCFVFTSMKATKARPTSSNSPANMAMRLKPSPWRQLRNTKMHRSGMKNRTTIRRCLRAFKTIISLSPVMNSRTSGSPQNLTSSSAASA